MAKLLQVDFGFNGPFGKEMANALVELAESINYEPGMLWKIWTENEKDKLGEAFICSKTKPVHKHT